MGKKKTDSDEIATPNAGAVANKDLMQRMNFLYQVASHLSQQPCLPEESEKPSSDKRDRGKRKGSLQDLAGFHVRAIKTIGNKSMVKIDPSVKRTICKACNIVLIPGQTSSVRVKSSKSHRFVRNQTCHNCGWVQRIPCPPRPQLDEESKDARKDEGSSSSRATDMSRREQRNARQPPLFEREGHVIYTSNDMGKTTQVFREDNMAGNPESAS
ncbi:hypothetical protein M408DRAFT_66196 [Serendipita vermifera MAFF 305830]|uniref:Rpr2-domain-containing protein n=1 Tax=Serendipita vermifera MAFF 305830 TaxID=933852 RepID=A0A0C2WWL1_SERVB|nr:hypothetical protein M408DRAFT_66196 [Serendipita vermifera MAFF 305830]